MREKDKTTLKRTGATVAAVLAITAIGTAARNRQSLPDNLKPEAAKLLRIVNDSDSHPEALVQFIAAEKKRGVNVAEVINHCNDSVDPDYMGSEPERVLTKALFNCNAKNQKTVMTLIENGAIPDVGDFIVLKNMRKNYMTSLNRILSKYEPPYSEMTEQKIEEHTADINFYDKIYDLLRNKFPRVAKQAEREMENNPSLRR